MWEVVEYVYLYTLLKYKTIPMCKVTQNNLKYEEKHEIFSTKLAYSIIKVENDYPQSPDSALKGQKIIA